MSSSLTLVERPWGAKIVIDRPPVNALSTEAVTELGETLAALHRAQPDVVVLTGAGSCFTAGADLKEKQSTAAELRTRQERGRLMLRLLREAPFPTIAAVNGACRGAGMNLVSGCDLRIARSGASFGLPEIQRGRAGGASSLRGTLPAGEIRWLAFTGDVMGAEEALRLGFVHDVIPEDVWEQAVEDLASRMSAHGKAGLYAVKESLRMTHDATQLEAHWIEQQVSLRLWAEGRRSSWPTSDEAIGSEGR